MPSETTRIEKSWRSWSGTPADIVLLARLAEKLLSAANAEDSRASVTVKHQRGERRFGSAEEAAEHLGEVDLTTVQTVHVLGTGSQWKDIGIIINFFKTGPYLAVEGQGDHRLSVAGIAEELSVELDRRGRTLAHDVRIVGALLAGALVMLAASIGARAADAPRGVPVALSGLGTVLSLVCAIPLIVSSGIELRPDGEQGRAQRWEGRLWRFGGWALTLVLGAALGALIQHWLE